MRETATRVLILMILSTTLSYGQQIWPGDANNNGVANSVDLLYWGLAYGATGTPRVNPSIDWTGQNISSMWPESTPNGINFVYADADGNGEVNDIDRIGAMENNIGSEHGNIIPDDFEIGSEANGDTRIRLFPSVSTTSPGNRVHIALNLGRSDFPVDRFYGMAIHLSYTAEYIQDGSLDFELAMDSWITNYDPTVKSIFHVKDGEGFAEIGITRTDHQDILGGYGYFGMLTMDVENMTDNQLPALLEVRVDSVMLITTAMDVVPVALSDMHLQITNNPVPVYCPNVIAPVCGSNGVVYINSCFAEQAGVLDYTAGVCNPDCVDPTQIDPNAICPTVYEPVCGCNGVTYLNACEAEAAGVMTYSAGPCNNDDCYDPNLVYTADGTTVNTGNGTITIDCPPTSEPVCGCNGVTYDNPCLAEANGISSYTTGTCDDTCIDASAIDPDAVCNNNYDPVCGCNGVTYPNACYAEAAGVVDYSNGTCGGSSTWCNEAIPIQCGDFLPNETTVGAGNNIITFPGCSGYTFYGPDKVYVINKTTAGDLQIGLEIVTPGLDLDMFLLAGNCTQTTCIGSSTTNNNVTNNEGILYEDAPIGIYYLVVDGQFGSSAGEYHLEVNCGYLHCGDAQALTCGEPFQYNNMHGNDDVSLYGCDGNIYNVENNGPEVVHHFTITQAGPVSVSLTGLTDNLELFLLRSCDRGDCIDFSQNAGVNDESISAYLDAGTYYVVVDGYNGAVSDYTLQVDCTSSCDFDMASLIATDADCGQNNGTISMSVSGGQPGFLLSWNGPVSGSLTTFSTSNTIADLPPGTYTITNTDANGCFITGTVTVLSIGDFSMNTNVQDAVCGESGAIAASFYNGTGPYHVYLTGPSSTSFNTLSTNINIPDLPIGNYQLFVTDDNGCVVSAPINLAQSSGNFSFNATPYAASCGTPGSIFVTVSNGNPPYQIMLTGPESTTTTLNSSTFNLADLPPGSYSLTIEDEDLCSNTEVVSIVTSGLIANVTPINGICSNLNALKVDIPSGAGPFVIGYSGPITGQVVAGTSPYIVNSIPNGTYDVTIQDASGCSTFEVVQLQNSDADLQTEITVVDGTCGNPGSVWIDLDTGIPPYTIQWSGSSMGSTSTPNDGINITNLPAGNYTFSITDNSGCNDLQSVSIQTTGGVNMNASGIAGICGALSSISIEITSGAADYVISWDGPESGVVTISGNNYDITDLSAGWYNVQVTDDNGCTDWQNIYIAAPASEELSINPVAISGWCNLGRIWLDIDGGALPFQVEWTGPVSGSEQIDHIFGLAIMNLPSGTYTVQVTDVNGCTISGVSTIENHEVSFNLLPTNVSCLQPGSITVEIMDGDPPYALEWSGTVSGSTTTSDPTFILDDLPPGTYSFTLTDNTLCSVTEAVAVLEITDVSLDPTPINGVCGQNGDIWVDINNGSPDFTVSWMGPVNGSTTTSNDGLNIPNLPSGTYEISVVDDLGCTDSEMVTISNAEDDLELVPTPISGVCGQSGDIWLDIHGGTPSYTITWTGPVNGTVTINNDGYNIPNLPSGLYNIQISDANGCDDEVNVLINNLPDDLELDPTPINGVCGQNGDIWLDIHGGTPSYTISWTGPSSGSVTINSNGYNIPNLPSGNYNIQITDVNGCNDAVNVSINNLPDDLALIPTPINGICGQNGDIWLDVTGGAPSFTITWTGPVNGTVTINDVGYNIAGVPSGDYAINVTDSNGCVDDIMVTINNLPDDLEITPIAINGVCDQPGSIQIAISGGTADYNLTWTGPVNGTATVSNNNYDLFGLPSGTYIIQITDVNGCNDMETVEINNVPDDLELIPTPINGICGLNGDIWLDILGGTASYTITWTGPVDGTVTINSDGYNIPNVPSGAYNITITDVNGCDDQITVNINNQENDLVITPTPINGVCGDLGTAQIAISGGSPSYTVSWTGPESGSTTTANNIINLIDLPSGAYVISLTDAQGCDADAVLNINNQEDDLTITPTPTNGACGGLGSIWLDISGGTADYTINWTGAVNGMATVNSNGYNIPNLPSGSYTITITDINGCDDTIMVTINNIPDDLAITANVTNGVCGDLGSILVNISGGTASYTLSWTGPANGTTTINGNSFNIPNLPSGTYNLNLSDANGCTDDTMATVDNGTNDLGISATPTNGVCGGPGSIYVSWTGGTANYVLSWSGPSSGSNNSAGNDFTIPNLPGGTYTISLTDANGCDITTSAILDNSANDLGLVVSTNNGVCGALGSLQVTIMGGTADYTINWSGPSSGSTTISGNSYNIPNLASGTYTINVTDANGCGNMATQTINNLEDDLALSTTITNALCTQAGSILLNITGGSPDYMISWTGPSMGTVSVSGNSFTIPNLVGGAYTITVTDANGCDQTTTVSVGNIPDGLEVTPTVNNGVCGQNASVSLDIIGGTAPYLINWTGPAMGTVSVNTTVHEIPNLPSGSYTISVTDNNGCSETIMVSINNQANDIALILTPNNGACDHLGSLDVNISGGTLPYTIDWSGPSSGSVMVNGNTFNIPNLADGTYMVSVSDADGCSVDDSATINNVSNDLGLTVTPTNGVCGANGSFLISVTGGAANYTYSWSGPSNGSVTLGTMSHTVNNALNGTYSVDVTDANGCTQVSTVTINNMANLLEANTTANNGLCGQTGSIVVTIVSGSPPYMISWTGPVSGSNTTSNSTYTIDDLTTGNYQISITDATGCSEVLGQFVSNGSNDLFSVPALFPGGCGETGEITVDIVGGTAPYSISWSGTGTGSTVTNGNSYTITDLATGNYNITVTDDNNCSDIDMVMLNNIPDNLDLVPLANDGICGDLGSITLNIFGGTPPYALDWIGPTSGSIIVNVNLHSLDNLPSGFYTITVEDGNGCVETQTATINNQGNDLQVSAVTTNGICGQLGSAELTISGGTIPYSISWDGPGSGSDNTNLGNYTIDNLASGSYSVSIIDDNGCEATTTFDINNLPDDLSIVVTPVDGVCGSEGEIQVSIIGGTADYTINWSGPESGSVTISGSNHTITNLGSGSYTVSITDANGCQDNQMASLNNTEDDLDAMVSPVNGDCFSEGYVWVSVFGGSGPYTISWTGPESGSQTVNDISSGYTIADLASGQYTIEVEDPNGCADTEIATINNLENDLAINLSPSDGICDDLGAIQLNISGGNPMYIINWSGPVNGNTTTSNSSFNIDNLPSGSYTVAVTDENGCTEMESSTVNVGEGDLSIVATPFNGGCQNNGAIWVDVLGGSPDYTITWSGPTDGSVTTSDVSYHIPNLPTGTYQIEVTDDSGCSENTSVYIDNTANLLSVSATPINGICGPSGTIDININGGNPDYLVSWSGPLSGSVTISNQQYTLNNLPSGTYTIVVMDSGGCVKIVSTTVDNDESGDLEIVVNVLPGGCGELGSIWVNIYNGDPHYIITWIGPTSGNITTLNEDYDVFLPDGEYEIFVMDGNGCVASDVVVITSIQDDLEVSISPTNGQCNNSGSIGINITGGDPDYTISWDGTTSGSTTTSSNYYEITDLESGTYTVSITDVNNCLEVRYVPINNQNNGFTLSASATAEDCDQEGSINVQITGGFPFYTISWNGPESGSMTVPTANYTIPNLTSGSYDISVTDENNCSDTYQIVVGYDGQSPIADFSSSITDLTASFTNLSADGAYLWDFGDGNISTNENPTHSYSAAGSYAVCLTVTNGCGSDVYCETVTATIPPGSVMLQTLDMSGASGASVQVPVTVSNLDMLVSLAGSVGIVDPAVGTITGLSPAMITPLYNANLQSFNFYDNSGNGISVNDGDILFYIDVLLTGDPGDLTQIALTNNPLMIEVGSMQNGQPTVMGHVSLGGDLSIIGTGNLAGAITTFWGDGIPNVEVDISTNAFSSMEMTDDFGNYDLPDLPAGDMYYVEPELDTLPANGLSTFALFIGQRFILGMEPIEIYSPYQIIAGDANCNGAFTTLDLFIIQQLIIGVSEEFAACPSWVFVAQHNNDMPIDFDAYNVFPYINVDTLMLMQDTLSDFVGVKVGDILGAASPDPFAEEDLEERNLDELFLTLENNAAAGGELVEFEFRSNNFDEIVSYQMNLTFDADRLSFDAFVPGPNVELTNVIAGTNDADEGSVRISWFNMNGNATTVGENEVLFTIRAHALENIDNLEGLFEVNSRYLRSEAHNGSTEPMDIVLELTESTTTNTTSFDTPKYELHQNVPNPFKDRTYIGFDLPEDMQVELTIHDNTGRVLKRLDGRYQRGYNRVELPKGDLESGVYYYTLKTSTYSATRNMVVIE